MTPTHKEIVSIFEEQINPSLAMHEGSAIVKHVREETEGSIVVSIEYEGSCVGCPSAQQATLTGIQNYLREELSNQNILVVAEVL
jgi:Fe-S cluster biogenesis protein NfuA